ncbi:MAG: hypothetical protein HYY17_08275 [Planctomycetes bacterium]|nr:hypothetical protein [Planctomycetota bacterium]
MNCLSCGHGNPATVTYCQKCGGRLDLTADQITASLLDKAKGEQARSTEYYARQALFFGIVLFLIGIAVFLLAGRAPEEDWKIPAVSPAAKYLRYEYKVEKPLPALDLPSPEEKK